MESDPIDPCGEWMRAGFNHGLSPNCSIGKMVNKFKGQVTILFITHELPKEPLRQNIYSFKTCNNYWF